MSINKFDLIVSQAKESGDGELQTFVNYCNNIRDAGRDFEIVITLHIDTSASGNILEPALKLGIDVNPLSPLDKSWQLYRDGAKFPKITAWAAKQPTFKQQIEFAISEIRTQIAKREMLITRITDLYLRPLLAEQGDTVKQELTKKTHGDRPKARKS